MKHALAYALLAGSLLLAACQPDDAPRPAAPLTASDSLKRMLSGRWQSTAVTNTFYTDDKPGTHESLAGTETYLFGRDGAFELRQQSFLIQGRWSLDRQGGRVAVATAGGELIGWEIKSLSETDLVLHNAQTTVVGDRAHRIETTVACRRAAD